MQQYLEFIKHIKEKGVTKSDRTGTGTKSIFGYQMRFDLQQHFPIVTAKKTYFKAVVVELLWFLKGDTNTKYLNDYGVKIWDEWQTESGELGPVYGEQWRSWNILPEVVLVDTKPILTPERNPTVECSFPPDVDEESSLFTLWLSLTSTYNGKNWAGVYFDPTWNDYNSFVKDVEQLPNYYKWKRNPSLYRLNPSYYTTVPQYRKDTCIWSTIADYDYCVNGLKSAYKVTTPDTEFICLTLGDIESIFPEINTTSVTLAGGNIEIDGITIQTILPPEGQLFRNKLPIDQVEELINQIKTNPDSRRLIISGWNPAVLPDTKFAPNVNAERGKAALPPCHTLMQFYVSEGKLSCQLYQRSADAFLGVPFNIASYALLTHMIAQVCNLQVGEFIHTFGDAHLYVNHSEQVDLLLSRTPKEHPQIKLNPEIKNIFDFKLEDFSFTPEYVSHPAIKAPIAV